jgi:hypothetical protein
VTGLEVRPANPTSTTTEEDRKSVLAEIKAWEKSDAVAMTILSKSLDEEHHSLIRDCTTAKQIWDRIKALKEQASVSSKLSANEAFHGYQWKEGMNVSSFLSGLSIITQKISSLSVDGIGLDEATIMAKVVKSLPDEYDSFRQSWRMTVKDTSKLSDLQSQLLAAETDMKERDESSGAVGTGDAFNAGRLGRNKKKKFQFSPATSTQDNDRPVCKYCKKPGHTKEKCFKRQRDQAKQSNQRNISPGTAATASTGLHTRLAGMSVSLSS